jgi:tRNA A37 methylthiotransferase MiaB
MVHSMKRKVAFLELPVFNGVLPLASGYMQSYAARSPELREAYEFQKYSMGVKASFETICSTMLDADANVYALSCYVWNSGVMKRLLPILLENKPDAYVVLGGPQVMHQGEGYLPPGSQKVLLCNGEGERTFSHILRALLSPSPDFSAIQGISFHKDGVVVTTPDEPRITDLSEIPSPFLENIFETGKYSFAVIETNRGCPFKCNYCFWGAAIGAKVYKYGEERVQREFEWVSASGSMYLFIADANWGMLKRDVDLSRFLAECKAIHGTPMSVYFCGAKNSPERVAEITEVLHEAGMVATQSVALQTMSAETLRLVNRDNIKTSAYTSLQTRLNQNRIASFIEMIWPLPGETLLSFQEGLAELCRLEADSFMIYPLLLMNNVELNSKRDEFMLVTRTDPDPNSEAEIVVGTREVGLDDYHEGVRFIFAITVIYTMRGLWCTGRYLSESHLMSYEDLLRAFVAYCVAKPDVPYSTYLEGRNADFTHHQFDKIGGIMHLNLHQERDAFDELLAGFVSSLPFWKDPMVRTLFEIDLVNRPYVYRNTRIGPKQYVFEFIRVLDVLPGGYRVETPAAARPFLERCLGALGSSSNPSNVFDVNHRREQIPYMPRKTESENWSYCHEMMHRIGSITPVWTEVQEKTESERSGSRRDVEPLHNVAP